MFKIAKRARKAGVYTIIAAMLIMMLPAMALAAPSSDIASHWAKAQIEDWINKGLVKGYPEGTFKPDNNISRAEFMALVNNAFGYEDTAAIAYTDVAADAWYAEVIAKAKAAGYIAGYSDGSMKPNSPITRQEAASVIMKVKKLQENSGAADQFVDSIDIAGWSKGAVGAVAAEDIMGGYPDGTFKAQNPIKRAEAVVALDKALGIKTALTYDQAGTYGPANGTEVIEGDVIVNVGSVALQNMTINGNLLLAKGIGQGEVTLKNVKVTGTTDIQGGGENSIIVIDSSLGKVAVSKEDGKIRIVISGSTTVSQVLANSGVKLEEKDLTEGGFKEIVIEAGQDDKIILVGTFESVAVKTAEVTIELPKETTVGTLTLDTKANITGQGTVQTAEVKASGTTFETAPKKTETLPGVTPPAVSKTPQSSGSVGSGGSSGGGGGGSPAPVVSAAIAPTTGVFDKKTAAQADVATTITWGDASAVTSVKNAEAALAANTDYTVVDNTLTIKKEYLATQATGNIVLTITFNKGNAVTLTITSSDTTPADAPSISLEYLGHSAFIMTTAEQKILMDPFEPDSFLGFPAAYTIADESSIDLTTVSHQHQDHNYVAAAPSVNQVIYGVTLNEEEMSENFVQVTDAVYGDVSLSTILLPHFEEGFPFGDVPNAGFIFETAGMRIVHPGDSFRGIIDGLTQEEITALKGETGIDILMLPIGSAFEGAHDSEYLVSFVNDLDPKAVIPIHQWNSKEQFIVAASGEGWEIIDKPATVNFSKDQLPEAGPVIWDMEQTVDFRPLFQSAAIDGSELTVSYNEALDENSIPAADDFMVMVNDSRVIVNEVEVNGTNLVLTLAEAVTSEDEIELDYLVGDNAIQDLAGNAANDFWGKDVENNTAVDPAPKVSSFSPANGSTEVGVNDNLVLTFDQNVTANATRDIFIYKASDDSFFEMLDAADTNKVTVADNVVTINPSGTFEYDTEYYIQIAVGAFSNATTGDYKGIADKTTWTFTTEANQAPTAIEVSISGTAKVGEVLTGNYTYTDNEGDAEGATTFKWYRTRFLVAEEIPGATGQTYTLTEEDADHSITFEVTPVAGTGTTTGTPVKSAETNQIADVLRVKSASTFDRNGNGVLDAYLIMTTSDIDDPTVNAGLFAVDGVAATGFSTGLTANDNMFWLYFAENGHSTKDLPELTVQDGAFQDLEGDSTRELTAAEDVEKDGADPIISAPSAENTTATGTAVKLTSNETGTAYYVVLPVLAVTPDNDQVKAGQDGTGADAALKGSTLVTENVEATINIAGLTPGTAYKVYLVAEDASGNLTYDVTAIDVTTPLE